MPIDSPFAISALGVLTSAWPHVATILALALSVTASGHAILRKRDTRAAVGWVALAWLVPLIGPLLYWLLGINRISRRAKALRIKRGRAPGWRTAPSSHDPAAVARALPRATHLTALARLGNAITHRPLVPGNTIALLDGGPAAYPAMLAAIDAATSAIALCSYIFDDDATGQRFVRALRAAVQRGVEVRVLIDAVGSHYSRPPVHKRLQRYGVRVALFLPTLAPARMSFLNLRNHRKILVVDGKVGFTGGMNIRDEYASNEQARDLHFRLAGPIVRHLMDCFAEDWSFTTGERLQGDSWFPEPEHAGSLLARGIEDGPDEDFDALRHMLLGAVSCARSSLKIATPYFLPDSALATALGVAALRGVDVEILLPERGNLPLVQWAATHQLWEVLEPGCRVYLSRPPFDHSKVLLVDDAWSLIGTANWDPRSLRLNFEFNVEAYGSELAIPIASWFEERRRTSREITVAELEARPLSERLRDGLARLLSPYL